MTLAMEDIAFSDWPGQPVDLSGSNSWLPAYGFQPPTTLLDKDDFLGNPDAHLFLNGGVGQHYVYLETIQEETSDDMRSESDISESRTSPVGWLATDSESGSVIRIENLDELDSGSEREIACPSKRRRQENLLSISDDDSNQSLSRSSSLIQFESLEKQCQDISSSSPSIFSSYSFDSLENQRKYDVSPDSLERNCSDVEPESDYYKAFKIDIPNKEHQKSRDSLLYNATLFSSSDSSESADSEGTLDATKCDSCRSVNNLKTWRSFDGLHANNNIMKTTNKISAENLSEDSGYSDNFCNFSKNKSSSIPNIAILSQNVAKQERSDKKVQARDYLEKYRLKNCSAGFDAYDGEIFQNFSTNFGVSYHDLSIFDKYDFVETKSPLVDRFMRNTVAKRNKNDPVAIFRADMLNIEKASECVRASKYNIQTSSEPNLLATISNNLASDTAVTNSPLEPKVYAKHSYFESCVYVSSVPKDLNLAGNIDIWNFTADSPSIAAKNWDLANLSATDSEEINRMNKRNSKKRNSPGHKVHVAVKRQDSSSSESEVEPAFKREGSYMEAMANMIDMSDDEFNPCYRDKTKNSTIIDFDKKILKAISETSIQSFGNSRERLDFMFTSTPTPMSSQYRNVKSTPNLAVFKNEEPVEDTNGHKRNSLLEMPRKSSLVNRSTSTSAVSSEADDKTLTPTKSVNGSTSSKGVTFCPVVAEVNWRDESISPPRDSQSLSSTPEIDLRKNEVKLRKKESPPPPLIRPEPRRQDEVDLKKKQSGTPPLLRPEPTRKSQAEFKKKQAPTPPILLTEVRHKNEVHLQIKQPATPPTLLPEPMHKNEVDLKEKKSPVPPLTHLEASLNSDAGLETMQSQTPPPQLVSTHNSEVELRKKRSPSPPLMLPEPRHLERAFVSQPDLQVNDESKEIDAYAFMLLQKKESSSQPNISSFHRRMSEIRKDDEGNFVKSYVDTDGIVYKHTHLGDVYKSPPTARSHVPANNRQQATSDKPVPAMESVASQRSTKPNKTGKLGGFFSRIASFRFSSRKNGDDKNKQKKKSLESAKNLDNLFAAQRLATKEDYIYIPLKGPAGKPSCNNNEINKVQVGGRIAADESGCLSAKPPLPKLPPRVVGASVKKRPEAAAQLPAPERRTIDSGDALPRPMEPMGLIETDLDTEVTVITSGAHVKTRSLMNLGAEAPPRSLAAPPHPSRPHKSMEFLLDKQNLKVVEPPENELQKGERVLSEHELRIQRSLRKLTVPDWYKQAEVPREGFLLKKPPCRESRWSGTGSKTTSLSSLGSSNLSPIVLSPTPQNQSFVRWSTSKLNSTASSPCASTRSSFNARQPNGSISPSSLRSSFSYRQPYLGWRSQERLSRPRTPAERLANSLIHHNQQQPQESPEIQTSIKEVTSAIVHYVSGLKPEDAGTGRDHSYDSQETASQRSMSVSPRGSQKLCWLESSFVGTRPLDSPQTPVTLTESQTSTPAQPSSLRLDLYTHNDFSLLSTGDTAKPSPGSTTLEDVLDSLLGLPSSTRAPSPSLQETASASTSPVRENDARISEQFRRRSEGSEPATRPSSGSRRVSFHSSPVLRCRYSRCGRVAVATSSEGLAFKNCHNCSYTYCSRACRRAHWEKHRKTCLFSRVGSLCRQVIAACKEKPETLHHLSVIARRGFLSHGLGAVKCFFPTPEAAESFLTDGLENLSEPTYICWKDLLPSEMGPQLYTELVKMCKNYNPDGKLILYVSVCVVSEAPAAGAVKWERQLVSRCAKMRLSKDVHIPERDTETPETLILTSHKEEPVQRSREISFNNIQRHLRQRGVSLRRHYPEVYRQLSKFVEGNSESFKAVTVYPRDTVTGKTFMCIIMPESEPENLEKVVKAGVRVRTVDVLKD